MFASHTELLQNVLKCYIDYRIVGQCDNKNGALGCPIQIDFKIIIDRKKEHNTGYLRE